MIQDFRTWVGQQRFRMSCCWALRVQPSRLNFELACFGGSPSSKWQVSGRLHASASRTPGVDRPRTICKVSSAYIYIYIHIIHTYIYICMYICNIVYLYNKYPRDIPFQRLGVSPQARATEVEAPSWAPGRSSWPSIRIRVGGWGVGELERGGGGGYP